MDKPNFKPDKSPAVNTLDKDVPENHQTQLTRDPSGKLVSAIGKEEKENGTIK